jgi:hypothetical protein
MGFEEALIFALSSLHPGVAGWQTDIRSENRKAELTHTNEEKANGQIQQSHHYLRRDRVDTHAEHVAASTGDCV